MLRGKLFKVCIIAIVLSFGLGTTVLASSQTNGNSGKNKIGGLVTSVTITQAQGNRPKIPVTPIKTKGTSKGTNQFKSKLDTLVTAGTITGAQETSIITALTPSTTGTSKTRVNIKTVLDALVTAGTITQVQETSVITALTPATPIKTKGTNQFKSKLDTLQQFQLRLRVSRLMKPSNNVVYKNSIKSNWKSGK
jgi:hypothetical protein